MNENIQDGDIDADAGDQAGEDDQIAYNDNQDAEIEAEMAEEMEEDMEEEDDDNDGGGDGGGSD